MRRKGARESLDHHRGAQPDQILKFLFGSQSEPDHQSLIAVLTAYPHRFSALRRIHWERNLFASFSVSGTSVPTGFRRTIMDRPHRLGPVNPGGNTGRKHANFIPSTANLAANSILAFHLFVLIYEEPTLRNICGSEYGNFYRNVRRRSRVCGLEAESGIGLSLCWGIALGYGQNRQLRG